ncbi:SGNH/GDSL hydrolase family protein [Gryllotalpicola daejeonensis]|uniref:SGNH/GDSL hydrolase family protein n=1 Tax=Gryllotalpicola daejeonensis TaxID=993087 RepID=A0ABP7ZJT4_9MICO
MVAGAKWGVRACVACALGVAVMLSGCTGGPPSHDESAGPSVTPRAAAVADVTTLGVLGDSISLGVNACAQPGECTAASWVMGSEASVDSLATRIAHATGRRPAIANGAVSGATIAALLQTAPAVVAAKPQLVTILIGANDACRPSVAAMTSAAEFRQAYGRLLDTVLDGLPNARVLALSVPDLGRLAELGQASPAIANTWSAFGVCGALLSGGRDAVARRVDDYNAAIEQLCATRKRCSYDGGAVHAQSFSAAELSEIDHFHPSRAGQARLARLAWEALSSAGG